MRLLKYTLLVSLIANSVYLAPKGPKRSKELNDKTFEHDTQATTGSTTGDWFVNFCSKKNKRCREIEPLWDELAEKLFGRLSVAHVDLKRKFYQFDGNSDDIEALHQFAIDSYPDAKLQGDIPQELSAFSSLWKNLLDLIEMVGEQINKVVMKNETEVNYAGMAVFFGIPLIIIFSMCVLILGGQEDSGIVGAKKQVADKNIKKNK
ncbi:UNKNOWN [Stylonychia lemnae]|uniref:Uncharacterized protein n=1 Tax=Stylonychia lemnae TaxID=5949 RepID=A0A078A0I3_STYLE|nr:UNKNOWN [Stylonychia lemnae]|eukprot:CDW75357.1 UNKNOWN [Stylonychia lemnae]